MPASHLPVHADVRQLASRARPAGASCQFCRWPLPAKHRHVIDTERCALLCSCSACYERFHAARYGGTGVTAARRGAD